MIATQELLTEVECLSKAAEMQARAEGCLLSGHALAFLDMARCWRIVAAKAAWQDAPT